MNRVLSTALLGATFALWLPGQQAAAPPLQKTALLTALRTGGLQPTELVEIVNRRGLDFPMSVSDEQELRAAGASDQIIDAMWAKENFEIKPGPPLSKEAIVASLQAGVPPRRLERMIRLRSAQVKLSRDVAEEIKTAGGTDALLGTILANIVEPPAPPPPPKPKPEANPTAPPPPKPDAKKYDELVTKAREFRKNGNHGRATELLAEAKKVDAQRPEAYSISGLIWMESLGSVLRADTEYSAAIERKGEIVVPMLHTHGRTKRFKQKSCKGEMIISHAMVKYASGDGHNYAIETGRILDVAVNSSKFTLGALGGGFHIKWSDKDRTQEEEDFRVDIEKDERDAGKLVVELIRKCLAR